MSHFITYPKHSSKIHRLFFKGYCSGSTQSRTQENEPTFSTAPTTSTFKPQTTLDQSNTQKSELDDEDLLKLLQETDPTLNFDQELYGNLPDEWVVMNRRSTSKTNTEDLSSYHNLIARYYYERNYEEVFRTFDNLKVHGLSLNASIYNFVLLALVAVSQFNRALVMFDEMKHSNVQPDSLTYDIIIRIRLRLGHYKTTIRLHEEMRAAKLKPTVLTYVNLLRAARFLHNSEVAKQIFEEMKEMLGNKIPRDAALVYIQTLCEDHKPQEAIHTMKQMTEQNLNFLPVSFVNIVLRSVIEDDYIEGCEYMFNYLQKFVETRKTQWDEGTLSRLLEAAARNSRFTFAEQIFTTLKQSGLGPTQAHFSALLLCYANGGFYSKAFDAIIKYCPPFVVHPSVREAIALACSKTPEEIDRAYLVLEDIYFQEKRPVPLECLNLIVAACAYIGDFNRALLTIQEFPKFSLSPNVETFNNLLLTCLITGQTEPIKVIIKEASKANVSLNAKSYEHIIRCYLKRDLAIEAISYLEEMLHRGLIPTYFTFYCMVASLKNNQPNAALLIAEKAGQFYQNQNLIHILSANRQRASRPYKFDRLLDSQFSSFFQNQSESESADQSFESPILRALKSLNQNLSTSSSSSSTPQTKKKQVIFETPFQQNTQSSTTLKKNEE